MYRLRRLRVWPRLQQWLRRLWRLQQLNDYDNYGDFDDYDDYDNYDDYEDDYDDDYDDYDGDNDVLNLTKLFMQNSHSLLLSSSIITFEFV